MKRRLVVTWKFDGLSDTEAWSLGKRMREDPVWVMMHMPFENRWPVAVDIKLDEEFGEEK
jgi:hypothetical protein